MLSILTEIVLVLLGVLIIIGVVLISDIRKQNEVLRKQVKQLTEVQVEDLKLLSAVYGVLENLEVYDEDDEDKGKQVDKNDTDNK